MQSKGTEVLDKIKELRNISSDTEQKLEKDGLSITSIPKEQLFNHNIKNIIAAIEALLRNEPSERPILRLEKEIPDLYNNLNKLKETPAGRLNSEKLDKIKDSIVFIEKIYRRL
ncbi:hypothetical protein HYU23_02945 [Candidatus Woesearchaeota archaeon]|nr:hypothetical protein [Candidatus Woesearchaeota archaeon]